MRSEERKAASIDKDNVRPVEGDGACVRRVRRQHRGKVRQLELENDILRGVVEVLRGASLGSLTNGEKTLLIDRLRRETGRRLSELTAFSRISKRSYEYQRSAIAGGDEYTDLRSLVVEAFEGSNKTRGYRYITHERRGLDEPVVVSEKVVRRIMAEEGCRVVHLKKTKHYSSNKGEISDAPDNLVKRDSHADASSKLRLSDTTEFGTPPANAVSRPSSTASTASRLLGDVNIAQRRARERLPEIIMRRVGTGRTSRDPHRPRLHYRWAGRLSPCDENGLVRSIPRKACSPDNSAMEGFFGRLKNRFFFRRD